MEIAGTIGKIKAFLVKNEQKIVLVIGFCLISAISFGFGTLWGQKWQQKPLVIEKLADIPKATENPLESQNTASLATQGSQEPKPKT